MLIFIIKIECQGVRVMVGEGNNERYREVTEAVNSPVQVARGLSL